jgi:hypothetical protein
MKYQFKDNQILNPKGEGMTPEDIVCELNKLQEAKGLLSETAKIYATDIARVKLKYKIEKHLK